MGGAANGYELTTHPRDHGAGDRALGESRSDVMNSADELGMEGMRSVRGSKQTTRLETSFHFIPIPQTGLIPDRFVIESIKIC